MSSGFRNAYNEKYKTYPNKAIPSEEITYKITPFIPTQNLPGVTITAPNLSKAQQLNGITEANPLSEAVNRNKAKRQSTSNRGQLYQEGGELPTAQKVEDRYKGGRRVTDSSSYFGDSISIRGVESQAPWYKYPAQIVEYIIHSKVSPRFNDTTYAERPSFIRPINGVVRAAGNNYHFGKKQRHIIPIVGGFVNNNYEKSSPQEAAEYETLKRRFNTAWNLAK